MRIILFGPPGSGKGIVGRSLSEKLHVHLIDVGNLLRKHIKNKDKFGKKVKKYVEEGNLVPSDAVIKPLKDYLKKIDCQKGYVITGYPRNLGENNKFNIVSNADFLVELVAPKNILKRRITGRRMCSDCGAVYNIYPEFYPNPKKKGVCDICGGKLIQRDDDTEEIFTKRIREYNSETKPVLKRYKDKLIVLNAIDRPEILVENILKIITQKSLNRKNDKRIFIKNG